MQSNVVRHSESLLIAWRLADLEARHLGQLELQPEHFFLGFLKLVELDVRAILSDQTTLTSDQIAVGLEEVERLRRTFHTANLDTTRTRRRLRKILPSKQRSETLAKGTRRSDVSRSLFSKAEQLLRQNNQPLLEPIHLVDAILQIESPSIIQALDLMGVDVMTLTKCTADALTPVGGLDWRADHDQSKRKENWEREKGKKGIADRLGRDVTELARSGGLAPVIGRKHEIRTLVQTLLRSRKNNAILIGEAGVGKTGIVEGLAQRIVDGGVPPEFADKRIVEISMGSLLAGTNLRGDLEGKLQLLIDQAKQDDRLILFIDEIHLIVGAGAGSGSAMDAANLLKPALARGEICVIGATTTSEYRRFIEGDAALARRFEVIEVLEPSREETLEILQGLRTGMEQHHGVTIEPSALTAVVDLTIRYLPDRQLPDKAIDVLDQACVQARMQSLTGDFRSQARQALTIEKKHVANAIAHRCKVAVGEVLTDEASQLLQLEKVLGNRIKGQPQVLASVCKAIRLAKSGLAPANKPLAVLLFAGPSGTGKTELAKVLAEVLCGGIDHGLVRVDMSELMDEHSVSKLIGSPPGFVGHDHGGQLTEAIRSKPSSIVLLDEIEKAHRKILDIFLQVFDEGFVTDARGRKCDFRNTIIIMTTNAGVMPTQRMMGFLPETGESSNRNEWALARLQKIFRHEFLNRIGAIAVFNPLDRVAMTEILEVNIEGLNIRLAQVNAKLSVNDRALNWLVARASNELYGARLMARIVGDELATPLSSMILREGESASKRRILVDLVGDRLTFEIETLDD